MYDELISSCISKSCVCRKCTLLVAKIIEIMKISRAVIIHTLQESGIALAVRVFLGD
jgi:hypothetical protein